MMLPINCTDRLDCLLVKRIRLAKLGRVFLLLQKYPISTGANVQGCFAAISKTPTHNLPGYAVV